MSFSTEIYKQISGEETKEDKPGKIPVQDLKSDQMNKAKPKRKTGLFVSNVPIVLWDDAVAYYFLRVKLYRPNVGQRVIQYLVGSG